MRGTGPRTTIARELSKFRKSKNPRYLASAVWLLFRTGRIMEVAYGAACFAFRPPSRLPGSPVRLEDHEVELAAALADLRRRRDSVIASLAPHVESSGQPLYCMDHGFAELRDGAILGEYANYSARLFHQEGASVDTIEMYHDRETVRHIHLVFRVESRVYVATGDTDKFLDEWALDEGGLRFVRRILKRLGGFTTVARIDGQTYFGSDFSERPNYIWCLETGRKFFFPEPAYTRYCFLMLTVGDRYIFTFHRGLSRLSGGVCYSVFDAHDLRFVGAGEYEGDLFVSDYVEPA